jgi:uncharacterized membrane protein YadS
MVATQVATTVKLARALFIVPLTLGLGFLERRRRGAVGPRGGRPPWFILGFLAAAALVTYLPGLRPAGQLTAALARQAMVVTLYLIGLGLSRASLRAVGARPLLLGVTLWIIAAAGTLLAVRLGLAVV